MARQKLNPRAASSPQPGARKPFPGIGKPKENADAAPRDAIDQLCVNTIRTLAIDAVEKAHSGHPGTAMAMAPLAYELWRNVLRYDPQDSNWPNRDRFVLSAGHASMLLYAMLHLCGVKSDDSRGEARRPAAAPSGGLAVTMDDIRRFRQLDSKCAGHPEHGLTSGVETTTGPLGQGCSTSVGMAIASNWLAAHYNRPDFTLFDYNIYALCSDGDMMEGVASEAASLAGHLRLANLCWIYDNNHITIEGHTSLAFDEDVGARFRAYGWNVHHVADANNLGSIAEALSAFRRERTRPTMIVVNSHIGYGSPHKQDTARARRTARRRGGQAHQARLWLAGGRAIPGPGWRARTFRRGNRATRRPIARGLARLAPGLWPEISRRLPGSWS